ncbi:MAG TPA: hypothetical protein VJ692_06245, partial [Nitrospiraceae bacterium]|nr:hypothetical protein [Nitrospiraceae bacterium]
MRLLTVLAYLFACIGAIAAALVGISFSDTYREQYLGVKLLFEDRIQLLLVSVVFWVMAYAAKLWGEFLGLKPHLQSVHVSGGQLSQKATRQGVENELFEIGDTLTREAWPYLDA